MQAFGSSDELRRTPRGARPLLSDRAASSLSGRVAQRATGDRFALAAPSQPRASFMADSSDDSRDREASGAFGLTEDMTCRRASSMLSAGQKSKLLLGAAFWTKPHIACLDEATNYLDVETVEALQRALRSFLGRCVVVTHNEQFIAERAQQNALTVFLAARRKLGPCKTDVKVGNFDLDSPGGVPLQLFP